MKRIAFIVLLLMFAGGISHLAWSQDKPEDSDNGIWIKKYSIKGIDKKFYYTADTVSQLCFSIVRIGTGAGYTQIECSALKKRPEWKNIIVWE